MKGVIVQQEKGRFIIITKDGRFIKVRGENGYSIGDEYEGKTGLLRLSELFSNVISTGDNVNRTRFNKRIATAFASIFLIFGMSTAAYAYMIPSNYVNIDINPSVELRVNRFNRVVKAVGLNEDGLRVLEELSLKNKPVNEAIKLVIAEVEEEGYLKEELENQVLVTVSAKDETIAKGMESQLGELVKEQLEEDNLVKVPITTAVATLNRHKEAEALGISPGKLNLIDKLQDVMPEINQEDYVNTSVKDIMKAIKNTKKEASVEEKLESNEEKQEEPANNLEKKDDTKEEKGPNDNSKENNGNSMKENKNKNYNSEQKNSKVNKKEKEDKNNKSQVNKDKNQPKKDKEK